jgi:hypothetical protein
MPEAFGPDNPVCIGCNKTPEEIGEYQPEATESSLSATEYVKREEGTYNPENGHFTCTSCYVRMGMPTAPGRGWKAP